MFKIGDKVVCIGHFDGHASNINGYISRNNPVKNEIYTICGFSDYDNNYIRLSELYYDSYGNRQSFNSKKFRKLDYDFVESVIEKIKEEELTVKI